MSTFGIARTGGAGEDTTANRDALATDGPTRTLARRQRSPHGVNEAHMDQKNFHAAVAAILNAPFTADTTTGRDDITAHARHAATLGRRAGHVPQGTGPQNYYLT